MWKKKHDFELGQVIKLIWTIVKGLKAKATFVLIAVLAMQAIAIYNIKRVGYPLIRIAEPRVWNIANTIC